MKFENSIVRRKLVINLELFLLELFFLEDLELIDALKRRYLYKNAVIDSAVLRSLV
jgi:hypothetical protein